VPFPACGRRRQTENDSKKDSSILILKNSMKDLDYQTPQAWPEDHHQVNWKIPFIGLGFSSVISYLEMKYMGNGHIRECVDLATCLVGGKNMRRKAKAHGTL
jgi:hypothetical protein